MDVPAQQLGQDHAVPEARDGEELGDALQEAEEGRLRVRDQRERERRHEAQASTCVRGPLWNQAKTNAPMPSSSAAMPCLTWWCADPASWPGKKPGSDL